MEVKHFIACVESVRILPKDPPRLVLHDVRYSFVLPPGEEFPYVIEKLCLFTRFYGAKGTHYFTLRVNWQEAAAEPELIQEIDSEPVEFDPTLTVEDRVFAVYQLRIPATGLLEFHLTSVDEPRIILASEYVEVRFP